MYESNESPTLADIYFACVPELRQRHNDVTMTLTPSNVIQYNACPTEAKRRRQYYPFAPIASGMQTANSWTRDTATKNNFLGNGGTELNTTSQLYDLEYRNYDPALGRMNGVDPMANKYSSLSPYNYSFNDPVSFNDVNGADPTSNYFYGNYFTYDDWVPERNLGWAQTVDRSGAGMRAFGHSMSFGLSQYSVQYQSGMANDIYRMSNSDYAQKYGTIFLPEYTYKVWEFKDFDSNPFDIRLTGFVAVQGLQTQGGSTSSDFIYDNNNSIGLGLEIIENGTTEAIEEVLKNKALYTTGAKLALK